jgi:type I restriction enzyme M protein
VEVCIVGVVLLGNTLGNDGTTLSKADVILANPPFGTAKGGGGPTRDDFTFQTSNKQLAFLQHIYRTLKPGGRAAVVLPDNVLFEAGIGTDIRKDLMNKCNLHTILRLPTGIFYAAGVKTNVLFFNKGTAKDPLQEENCTAKTWVYDLRTNMPSFGKRTPFSDTHLKPFEKVFGKKSNGSSKRKEEEWSFTEDEQTTENTRWRCFNRDWITERGDSLDISWLKDDDVVDAADLLEPIELAAEAMAELVNAISEMNMLMVDLGNEEEADQQISLMITTLSGEVK